jgi:hypothetical protein
MAICDALALEANRNPSASPTCRNKTVESAVVAADVATTSSKDCSSALATTGAWLIKKTVDKKDAASKETKAFPPTHTDFGATFMRSLPTKLNIDINYFGKTIRSSDLLLNRRGGNAKKKLESMNRFSVKLPGNLTSSGN